VLPPLLAPELTVSNDDVKTPRTMYVCVH